MGKDFPGKCGLFPYVTRQSGQRSGIFSGKKGRVIASEEVYQSGVQVANSGCP
ncbi:MAG: hypothetical protein ACLSD6_07340 [Clostridium sp.]